MMSLSSAQASILTKLRRKISNQESTRILFVCSGNIMRSPYAEMIFEKILVNRPCESQIISESGAVVYQNSSGPVPEIKNVLLKEGITKERIAKFYPRHLINYPHLFQEADLILVMEFQHLSALDSFKNKTFLLKKFTTGVNEEISDPYFHGSLSDVLKEIKTCLMLLAELLCNKIMD